MDCLAGLFRIWVGFLTIRCLLFWHLLMWRFFLIGARAGTNLVAMEAMASGVPSILSYNTGHLDLIKQDNCLRLWQMSPSQPFAHYSGVSGWMEPEVDEMAEALEKVYINSKEIDQMAKKGTNLYSHLIGKNKQII